MPSPHQSDPTPRPALHRESRGQGSPVVLLHGFTQSGASWGPVADGLAAHHTVVSLDAPGHRNSATVAAGLADGAGLMVEAAPVPAAWIGYSLGGRFALHVALGHPDAVTRLVLVSATAGIEDPLESSARREHDEALARRVESEGVEPFVKWWLGQPLFSTLPAGSAAIESRLDSTAAGLASSLRLAGTGVQEPLWSRLASLSMPVLVVTGELDRKYTELGRRMAGRIGSNATHRVMAGAGHACHLERPADFLELVAPFLAGD